MCNFSQNEKISFFGTMKLSSSCVTRKIKYCAAGKETFDYGEHDCFPTTLYLLSSLIFFLLKCQMNFAHSSYVCAWLSHYKELKKTITRV